jgi:hypothetical protein
MYSLSRPVGKPLRCQCTRLSWYTKVTKSVALRNSLPAMAYTRFCEWFILQLSALRLVSHIATNLRFKYNHLRFISAMSICFFVLFCLPHKRVSEKVTTNPACRRAGKKLSCSCRTIQPHDSAS